MDQKGNTTVIIILVIILTLLLIFVFFGNKIGATDDFSVDSIIKDGNSSKTIANNQGASLDTNLPPSNLSSVEEKATISGFISGIKESKFSNKEVSISGEVYIAKEDGTVMKLSNPVLYNFEGTISIDNNLSNLVGFVTKIVSDSAEIEFKSSLKISVDFEKAKILDVIYTLERAGLSGELLVNDISLDLDNSYLRIKSYDGDLLINDLSYFFDGNAEMVTIKQDGKEITFK